MTVWIATKADIDEGIAIAALRYPGMNIESTKLWARARIDHPMVSIMRTENVVSCVAYTVNFWAPRDLNATMVFFASRKPSGWEAYSLMKAQLERGKQRGCKKFSLGSETGIDLGPIARRLGFVDAGPNYQRGL